VVDSLLRSGAFILALCGMAWLALAMDTHWLQVRREERQAPRTKRVLRGLGVFALFLSLALALWLDHGSVAPLVWVMALTTSALVVSFVLAFRPRWLAWLVAWLPKQALCLLAASGATWIVP
jgi:hypothetical protein